MSPSTEQYDRGEKLRQYQQIASLSHVVLVSHEERRIEVWSRSAESWHVATARSGERAELKALSCVLVTDDVYRNPLAG